MAAEFGITGETLPTWVRKGAVQHLCEQSFPALRQWSGCRGIVLCRGSTVMSLVRLVLESVVTFVEQLCSGWHLVCPTALAGSARVWSSGRDRCVA
ncbi:hypothetical protein AVL59_22150 [Streptomyces griseochromogenes]|uniref:Uncharacterized protein n=1 Tax=Streptomyces griseochromogenes TaxID=68214 RepID=A0A1B1AZA6_9ACTN|nr:hypothetical protein AVL59_22150 [Streptomyces griseochromogenes]